MHSPAPPPSVVYATLTVENSDTIQIVQNAARVRLDDMGVFFRENQFSYEPQGRRMYHRPNNSKGSK